MRDLGRFLAAMVGVALVGGPLSARAQVAPAFPELLRQADQASPRMTIGRAGVEATKGIADQAAARLNPTVSLEMENFAGQSPFDGFNRTETTLVVQLPVELGGKREARVSAALAEVTAAEAGLVQARSEFVYDLAIAYATAEATAARTAIAADARELAEADARTARLLVENGREAEVRAVQAKAAAAAAQAELETARAEAEGALVRLSVLVAAPQPFVSVAGGLLDASFISPPASGAESPAVLAARAERDAAARRIDFERHRLTPDLTLSVGARRFREGGTTALVAGASLPLPLFDRNRGAIAAAVANATAAEARLAQTTTQIATDRRIAFTQMSAATTRLAAAMEAVAAAAEAYRLARVGYDAGRLQFLEVLNSRRALIEARGRTLDARLARVRAAAELARAQGTTLAVGAS